jgi:general secretion pathway protein D
VFAEVSSVTGYSQGYPTISQREASTSATVKDGDSFVIGGLTQESELQHHNKIPGVGDVPGVGELFRSENTSRSKTDLYIVITPHVVRGHAAGPAPIPPAAK